MIDNASRDDTQEVLKSLSVDFPFRHLVESRAGLSHARNRGVIETSGDWLVFLDDDVEVPEGYFVRIAETIADFPAVAYLGTGIQPEFDEETSGWVDVLRRRQSWYFSALDLGSSVRWFDDDGSPFGASMIIKRECLPIDPFSPDFGYCHGVLLPGEEVQLFERIRADGHRGLWVPDATVKHFMPQSRRRLGYLLRRAIGQGRLEVHIGPVPAGRFSVAGVPAWLPVQAVRDLSRCIMDFCLVRDSWALHLLDSARALGSVLELRRIRKKDGPQLS